MQWIWNSVQYECQSLGLELSLPAFIIKHKIIPANLGLQRFFPYAPESALDWRTRREVLMGQLSNLGADIICLQEVGSQKTNSTAVLVLLLCCFEPPYFIIR